MTDRAAFLRAIVADPDADDKRLVFADWLAHGAAIRAEQTGDGRPALCRGRPLLLGQSRRWGTGETVQSGRFRRIPSDRRSA